MFQIGIYDDEREKSGILYPLHNTRGTINYVVLSSYYYLDDGSESIYNQYEASGAARQPVIYNKSNSSFSYAITKLTGDKWNGGVRFLVIYY